MKLLAALALLALVGCDSVVSREVRSLGTDTTTVSCTKKTVSYCTGCGPDFTGQIKCGFRLRYNCPGSMEARVEVQEITRMWESGDVTRSIQHEVLEELGACK